MLITAKNTIKQTSLNVKRMNEDNEKKDEIPGYTKLYEVLASVLFLSLESHAQSKFYRITHEVEYNFGL